MCANLTNGLGIEFSLKELRAVSWQVIGVHELLPRSFVRCLQGEKTKQTTKPVNFLGSCKQSKTRCDILKQIKKYKGTASSVKKRHSYFVQLLCVAQSQSHVHGISVACEGEGAWMLTIASFIQCSFSCFSLLNIQRTNGDPPCTFIVVVVI